MIIIWNQFALLMGRVEGPNGKDLVFSLHPPYLVAFEVPSDARGVSEIFSSHSHDLVSDDIPDYAQGFQIATSYARGWVDGLHESAPCGCGPIGAPEENPCTCPGGPYPDWQEIVKEAINTPGMIGAVKGAWKLSQHKPGCKSRGPFIDF